MNQEIILANNSNDLSNQRRGLLEAPSDTLYYIGNNSEMFEERRKQQKIAQQYQKDIEEIQKMERNKQLFLQKQKEKIKEKKMQSLEIQQSNIQFDLKETISNFPQIPSGIEIKKQAPDQYQTTLVQKYNHIPQIMGVSNMHKQQQQIKQTPMPNPFLEYEQKKIQPRKPEMQTYEYKRSQKIQPSKLKKKIDIGAFQIYNNTNFIKKLQNQKYQKENFKDDEIEDEIPEQISKQPEQSSSINKLNTKFQNKLKQFKKDTQQSLIQIQVIEVKNSPKPLYQIEFQIKRIQCLQPQFKALKIGDIVNGIYNTQLEPSSNIYQSKQIKKGQQYNIQFGISYSDEKSIILFIDKIEVIQNLCQ